MQRLHFQRSLFLIWYSRNIIIINTENSFNILIIIIIQVHLNELECCGKVHLFQ